MFKCPWCGTDNHFYDLRRPALGKHLVRCKKCNNVSRSKIRGLYLGTMIVCLLMFGFSSVHSVFPIIGVLLFVLSIAVYIGTPYVRYVDNGDTHRMKEVPVGVEWVSRQEGGLPLASVRIVEDWVLDIENPRELPFMPSFGIVTDYSQNKTRATVWIPANSSVPREFYMAYKGKRVMLCKTL
ncbi:MAG: hypothetical protein IJZ13_09520 [Clostridia bacterium]|nr:hypothetical protein [Clostridia bacterium]